MRKIMVTGLVSTVVLGGFFFSTQLTEASTWTANSPESLQLTTGQTSYTMKLGDTLWAISQRVNITVNRLAEINAINLATGEQYNLPVGRMLSFNGDKVTATDAAGTVVSEAIITNEQKVNPTQGIGEVVDPTITTPSEPVTDGNTSSTPAPEQPTSPGDPSDTGNTPTSPSEPENPATPTDPTNPEEPTEPSTPEEKVYRGDIIPGVNNGAIGTWTNREEMDAFILAHWAENTANGTWTENYVASTNGYGWIAEFY